MSLGHLLRVLLGWRPSHKPLEWVLNLCEQHPRFPLRSLTIDGYPSSLKEVSWKGRGERPTVEEETEASKKHRSVSSPGPRRHVRPCPPGLPNPLFCLMHHFAEPCLAHKEPHLVLPLLSLPSVLTPALSGTQSISADCPVVSASACRLSWTVTCTASYLFCSQHSPSPAQLTCSCWLCRRAPSTSWCRLLRDWRSSSFLAPSIAVSSSFLRVSCSVFREKGKQGERVVRFRVFQAEVQYQVRLPSGEDSVLLG